MQEVQRLITEYLERWVYSNLAKRMHVPIIPHDLPVTESYLSCLWADRYMESLDDCPAIIQQQLNQMTADHLGEDLHDEAAESEDDEQPIAADPAEFQQFVEEHQLTDEQQQVLDKVLQLGAGLVAITGGAGAGAHDGASIRCVQ